MEIKFIRKELKKGPRRRPPRSSFGDSEMVVIDKALPSYLSACEQEIANGKAEPFTADRVVIEQIYTRLSDEYWRSITEAENRWARQRLSTE
jgi:hypothetical protein